jgi:hypothetical protein
VALAWNMEHVVYFRGENEASYPRPTRRLHSYFLAFSLFAINLFRCVSLFLLCMITVPPLNGKFWQNVTVCLETQNQLPVEKGDGERS